MEPKYVGNFQDRDDVAQQFEVGTGSRYDDGFKPAEDFPTDDELIYAEYETPDYEGYAFVLFQKGGKLYEVTGSHCSCMGLEGQWAPEETSWDAIAIRNVGNYSGAPQVVIEEAKKRVDAEDAGGR